MSYENSKIYKLVNLNNNDYIIGSTKEKQLSQRLAKLVHDFKEYLNKKRNYSPVYDIIKDGNYKIILIEAYPCKSIDELNKRESEIIDQHDDCMNKKIINTTKRNKISQSIKCDCGGQYTDASLYLHEKSKRHQKYIKCEFLNQQSIDVLMRC